MADDEEPAYDVAVNVHKGAEGYGIYFTQKDGKITVTKLDKDSEAERAGVQPKDELASIQDLDKVYPTAAPGTKVAVSVDNYQEALNMVRQMKYCRLEFRSPGFGF